MGISSSSQETDTVDLLAQFERHLRKRAGLFMQGGGPMEEAAVYLLLAPGAKRERPLMILHQLDEHSCGLEVGVEVACVVEMLHTYSLIHDDLMDRDSVRRGQPTVHHRYGERLALLSGDYLFSTAFEHLLTQPGLSESLKVRLLTLLTRRIGQKGMLGGQAAELGFEGGGLQDRAAWIEMIAQKTGALISAAIECGAILAGRSARDYRCLQQVGYALGIVFQLLDDLSDEQADRSRQQATYVTCLGKDCAQEQGLTQIDFALEQLGSLTISSRYLEALAHRYLERLQSF